MGTEANDLQMYCPMCKMKLVYAGEKRFETPEGETTMMGSWTCPKHSNEENHLFWSSFGNMYLSSALVMDDNFIDGLSSAIPSPARQFEREDWSEINWYHLPFSLSLSITQFVEADEEGKVVKTWSEWHWWYRGILQVSGLENIYKTIRQINTFRKFAKKENTPQAREFYRSRLKSIVDRKRLFFFGDRWHWSEWWRLAASFYASLWLKYDRVAVSPLFLVKR